MSNTDRGRVFFGLFIIAVGIIFLLGSLDTLDVGDVFSTYWPMIIVIFGVSHLFSHKGKNTRGGGIFLILIGGFFQLNNLDLFGRNAWNLLWPALIIAVGLWVLVTPGTAFHHNKKSSGTVTGDLSESVLLSGVKRRVESQQFGGGKASVLLGSLELDFYNTKLARSEATIEVSAVLGEMKIFVPRDWKVVVESSSVLGEIRDQHKQENPGEKASTLIVKASAVFGEISVRS